MLQPPEAAPNTATWSLNVASAGTYNVYARWTAYPESGDQRAVHRELGLGPCHRYGQPAKRRRRPVESAWDLQLQRRR